MPPPRRSGWTGDRQELASGSNYDRLSLFVLNHARMAKHFPPAPSTPTDNIIVRTGRATATSRHIFAAFLRIAVHRSTAEQRISRGEL
jgi:hypothetical protein